MSRFLRILFIALVGTLLPITAHALQVTGLRHPAGILVDPPTETYFISNQNGGATERDNNGFITKLNRDGKVVALKFIEGGQHGVTLHAPKGMVLVDRILYVADIDHVRGFDVRSGRPVAEIDFSGFHIDFLAAVATDGAGWLFVADAGTDTIYKINVRHDPRPAVLVQDKTLSGPNGLAVHPSTGALIAVSWNTGRIIEISRTGAVNVLFSNSFFNSHFGNLSGVDFDAYGNMYVSDFSQGKILRIDPRLRIQTIAEFLTTPATVAIDRKNHLILVSYLSGDAAEINGLGHGKKSR
jgi:DNA-binding beta-propeller fold protein YncE